MFTPTALRFGVLVLGCAVFTAVLSGCPRTSAPTVSSTDPANGATGVALNAKIAATFSEAMNPATINATTFTLARGTTPVPGTVTYSGVTAVFDPTSNLAPNTLYTAKITTGAEAMDQMAKLDACDGPAITLGLAILLGGVLIAANANPPGANVALAEDFVWSFTTGATPDTTAPIVNSTVPSNGATGVSLSANLSATFSETMDPLTITMATFTLRQGTTPIAGTVTYSGVTAVFNPAANLAPNTAYSASITIGAEDLAGNPLASNYVWSFTTGAAPDTTAPIVSSTIPANHAAGVPLDQSVGATFNEAMDPLTINTATFTMSRGTTPIPGTVIYAGVTATFNPTSALAPNTLYTATITTGAEDLAGNPLASNYVWTFTTGAAPDTTAPMVSSTDPADDATGVPLNKRIAATFSEAMDPLTITTAAFTLRQGTTPVLGVVTYAGVTATFTPVADLAPNTTYTATIWMEATDLAGNPLASDYVWTFTTGAAPDTTAPMVSSTVPANGAVGVLIGRNLAATFSEAMDPLTLTTATFTLRRGTTPVSGAVNYAGVTATFNPTSDLAPNTVYTATITTGAEDLAGNPLASNFVWTFTTGATPDTTAPMVSSTDPADGAIGVPLNKRIAATFSEAMDPLTIATTTFTLDDGTASVPGTVTYAGVTATFTPVADLAPNTTYTAAIWMEATDLAGNPMASDYVWTFTTGATPDTTAPMVSSTDPADGAIGVPLNKRIAATFSEAMDPLTIATTTFTLDDGTASVPGTVTYAGVTATFTPVDDLAPNTTYTAAIWMEATDLAGNPMASDYVWTFTTGAILDTTAPMVSSTDPADGAIGVPLNKRIAATFSEAMDPLTIATTTFTLDDEIASVPGTVTYAGVTATFTPVDDLAPNTTYTAAIWMEATDLAGNPMAEDYVWSFTTGVAPDTDAPTVILTDPADGANGVALNKKIAATFSEAMDPLTITTATFTVDDGIIQVLGTVAYAGVTATFTPVDDLAPNTTYTATIWMEAADLAGNPMTEDYAWTFTTGAAPDTDAPTVILTDPADGATGVSLNKKVTATFSETMDPLTITTTTFTLDDGIAPVPGTVTYAGVTATFTPADDLAPYTEYAATVWMEATDLAGNPMTSDYMWTFTTGEASIDLGSANAFAILAGSTVSNTGPSIVTGDLGVSPGTAVVGFPPGILNGAMFSGVGSAAGQAKLDLTIAFNDAAGRATNSISLPGDLSGLTLYPGLYTNSTSVMLSVGNVTLDAQGDSGAVFIFQMGSTLTTGAGTQVVLSGGAKADNIYWQVGSSATLGTTSIFKGNILAQESITLATGANLEGRALTQTAAVTLDAAVITVPAP